MSNDARFLRNCKMTAVGGSEKGTCVCVHPKECRLRLEPDFVFYRGLARARMQDYLETGELPDEAKPS